MVFSSHVFLFYFLPLTLVLYFASPRRARHLVLTLLSYVFYGWANPLFSVLMLASTLIDYTAGLAIAGQFRRGARNLPVPQLERGGPRSRAQRAALILSVCSNLSLLAFFKYFNFGIDTCNALVRSLGLESFALDLGFRVTLPLGISFYTFQAMSYTIDVYRGDARAVRSFIDFACYVSMFPQLVAGPIIRYSDVADQLAERTHTLEKFARGAAFVSLGLAKKVLLANVCGKVADTAFNAGSVGTLDAWYGAVAYAFQIYFDFSGYSDMAIGLGLMLGFTFARNFDSPYRAQSITEFWRRWHISLSTWLRDYLYIPLGGNRKGEARTLANLAIVMLLGGLWHGAAWTFVVWGGMHGAMLIIERLLGKRPFYAALPAPVKTAVTFVVLCFTWVFFRSSDLSHALGYCGSMLGLAGVSDAASLVAGLIYKPYYLGTFAVAAGIIWTAPQTWDWTKRIGVAKVGAVAAMLWLAVAALSTQSFNPFIYFIF